VEDRQRLKQHVEDMLAVAEMQGTAGWQVIMRELDGARATATELLVTMDVHRFAGKRGIEARGRLQEMKRLGELADAIIQRGAEAQRRLFADDRVKSDVETVTRV
jgi:hypothetical protein